MFLLTIASAALSQPALYHIFLTPAPVWPDFFYPQGNDRRHFLQADGPLLPCLAMALTLANGTPARSN